MVDPDIQMAGGGGEGGRSFRPEIRGMPGLQKKHFWPLRALVWLKNKGGGGTGPSGIRPGIRSLDPPLKLLTQFGIKRYLTLFFLPALDKRSSASFFIDESAKRAPNDLK